MDTNGVLIIYFLVALVAAFLIAELGKTRKIGYWGAFFITLLLSPLLGLLFVGFSDRETKETHRYQDSLEQAKREEFKGNIATAIDKYQDTLYYLKNDYPNLNSQWKDSHQNLVTNIQNKIEELQTRISDTNKTS